MRLLHVTTVAPTLRAFLLPYARHFRSLGWRVDALTGCAPVLDAEVGSAFDAVHTVAWSRGLRRTLLAGPSCYRQIRALVREHHYDIVHVHTPIASFITRLALRKLRTELGIRVVYTAHGFHFHAHGNFLTNGCYRLAERLAGRWTDALIVINQEDYEAARKYRIVAEAKLHRVSGIGIDLAFWSRDQVSNQAVDDVRQRWRIKSDTPVLLCVADLISRKRHVDLLRGFAAFLAMPRDNTTHTPVLVLAGDGPQRGSIEACARRLGLTDQVRFVGFQSELRPYYRLADVTVLVSLQEGLPRSLMESLAMETPVIATDVRGNHEVVDGTCGLLVPPRDASALAGALRQLFCLSAVERQKMGGRGRERMAEFSITRCLAQTEAVYASLDRRRGTQEVQDR